LSNSRIIWPEVLTEMVRTFHEFERSVLWGRLGFGLLVGALARVPAHVSTVDVSRKLVQPGRVFHVQAGDAPTN
jgi:hypothetical protein